MAVGRKRPHLSGRPKGEEHAPSPELDRRARFVRDLYAMHPSWLYIQIQTAVQKEFECCATSAQTAIKHYNELLRESCRTTDWASKITAGLERIVERAERTGDLGTARRALMDLRAITGAGAPDRMQVTVTDNHASRVSNLSDEDLELFASKLDGAEPDAPPTEH